MVWILSNSKLFVVQMKGMRQKRAANKIQEILEYERLRFDRLKKNEDFLLSQGFKPLTNKVLQAKCREFANCVSEDVHSYEDVAQQKEAGNQLRMDKQAAKQQVEKQHRSQQAKKQQPQPTEQHQQHQHIFEKQQGQQDSGTFFSYGKF